MLLRRLYDSRLAQASYLVGCQATGEAIVVDPARDVHRYVEAAAEEGVRITHVTETHIHADYLSGARELAHQTGARLYLSAEGGSDWQYAYAREANAVLLRDGDTIAVGNVRLDVWHTPGHTPEHLIFLVTDTPAADRPMAALTGDFVFVGDVGRPDLLERAAGVANTMEASARTLLRSLRRFAELPDWIQIWPGHGAGSACGKALGAVPSSTLGYERIANWAFAIDDEERFVREVLAGQPEPPRYFAVMKRMNREGPALLGGRPAPRALAANSLAGALSDGAQVVDTRSTASFGAGHVPGTLNMPLGSSFTTYAGTYLDYDRDIVLIADGEPRALDAALALASIGLDRVSGWVGLEAIQAWCATGATLDTITHLTAEAVVRAIDAGGGDAPTLLDVRTHAEWEQGHLPGVDNVPTSVLLQRIDELDPDAPLVLQCRSGSRSAVAASVLKARGFRHVANLTGGIRAWEAAGREVER